MVEGAVHNQATGRSLALAVPRGRFAERDCEADGDDILLKHDPIKIYFPEYDNNDEYIPEARDIATHLCTSQEKCLDLICAAFVRNFDVSIAGDRDRYTANYVAEVCTF